MGEILSTMAINDITCSGIPGLATDNFFLTSARALGNLYLGYRKITLAEAHPVKFAAGSALALAVGQSPTIQQVARAILGALSIIRCTKALCELNDLYERCGQIMDGSYYIIVLGDRFNIMGDKATDTPQFLDRFHYANKMRYERCAALFETIGKMIDVFCNLILHLSDAYVAYNEECLSEVVIHSKDLWDELTSKNSYLYDKLAKAESINQLVFGKQSCWALSALQQVVHQAVAAANVITQATQNVSASIDRSLSVAGAALHEADTRIKEIVYQLPRELHFDPSKPPRAEDPSKRLLPPIKRRRPQTTHK